MYAFALGFEIFTENVSFFSLTVFPTTETVIVDPMAPAGMVRVPLVAV